MKNKVSIFAVLILTILISCSKVNNRNMTVIKDCTGSYLRFNGNDYHICNEAIVENYGNGTEVKASFKKIDDCPDSDEIVCRMLHNNEGWINVTKIE
jgi:hypothetical protein